MLPSLDEASTLPVGHIVTELAFVAESAISVIELPVAVFFVIVVLSHVLPANPPLEDSFSLFLAISKFPIEDSFGCTESPLSMILTIEQGAFIAVIG